MPVACCDLLSVDRAIESDLAGSDLSPVPDMAFVTGPSCNGLANTCGSNGSTSCCDSPRVSGGNFKRSYDTIPDGGYDDPSYTATISDFRLDKYEVTVGRFRAFYNLGLGTQASPPPSGVGANPNIPNSGWDSTWNSNLTVNSSAFKTAFTNCSTPWTDSASTNENRPMVCLNWYEAFVFCAWDQGRLPTEAEWNYAAAGASDQRAYPWSSPPASVALDDSFAIFAGGGASATQNVGSRSPRGDGRWGQSDLAGNVNEWVLDWYLNPYNSLSCADCANLTPGTERVFRGGSIADFAPPLRTGYRGHGDPKMIRGYAVGFRCARNP
jgi:formylglycine-generating enzyme required for sulfatase activity